jgi:hypothetical protein
MILLRYVPGRDKPVPRRNTASIKDCAAITDTFRAPIRRPPPLSAPALWAAKSFLPPQLLQIRGTGRLVLKPRIKLRPRLPGTACALAEILDQEAWPHEAPLRKCWMQSILPPSATLCATKCTVIMLPSGATECCHLRRSPRGSKVSSTPEACGAAVTARSGRCPVRPQGSKVRLPTIRA